MPPCQTDKKEALKSHFWKQEKAFTTGNTIVSQSKVNTSSVVLSTKLSSFKPSPSSASKKQSNFLQADFFSKLANNSKLTSDEHKKYLKNNLCLYYGARDYKLNFCSKKQTTVTSKGYSVSATANLLTAASKKPLEK